MLFYLDSSSKFISTSPLTRVRCKVGWRPLAFRQSLCNEMDNSWILHCETSHVIDSSSVEYIPSMYYAKTSYTIGIDWLSPKWQLEEETQVHEIFFNSIEQKLGPSGLKATGIYSTYWLDPSVMDFAGNSRLKLIHILSKSATFLGSWSFEKKGHDFLEKLPYTSRLPTEHNF